MEVLKDFYCIQDKKTYKLGEQYKGKRKDLKGYVNYPKAKQNKK